MLPRPRQTCGAGCRCVRLVVGGALGVGGALQRSCLPACHCGPVRAETLLLLCAYHTHTHTHQQACVYDLYDLISLAADQLPQQPTRPARSSTSGGRGRSGAGKRAAAVPVDTEALAACTRIVADLTPGSSAHVELATEYMVRCVCVTCVCVRV